MQFRKWAGLTVLMAVAACGKEGQHWYGTLEHDGKVIEYETWYHDPGMERVAGNDGISYRIVVDGKTASMAGNHIPDTWRDAPKSEDLGPMFWGAVAEQFKAIKPGKDHKDEYIWIYNSIVAMRDVPRTLPANFFEQQTLILQEQDPEWAVELKASQEAGQRMMADYRRDHPEEFDEGGNDLPEV